jgi:hypothetical protein
MASLTMYCGKIPRWLNRPGLLQSSGSGKLNIVMKKIKKENGFKYDSPPSLAFYLKRIPRGPL